MQEWFWCKNVLGCYENILFRFNTLRGKKYQNSQQMFQRFVTFSQIL